MHKQSTKVKSKKSIAEAVKIDWTQPEFPRCSGGVGTLEFSVPPSLVRQVKVES